MKKTSCSVPVVPEFILCQYCAWEQRPRAMERIRSKACFFIWAGSVVSGTGSNAFTGLFGIAGQFGVHSPYIENK